MKKSLKISSIKLLLCVIITWFVVIKLSTSIRRRLMTIDLAYKKCGNNIECVVRETEHIEQLSKLIAEKTANYERLNQGEKLETQKLLEDHVKDSGGAKLLTSLNKGENPSTTFFLEFQKEKQLLEQNYKHDLDSLYQTYRRLKFRYQSEIKINEPDDFDTIKKAENEMLQIIDYENFPKQFIRLPGWPSSFPENLTNYRVDIIKSTNFTSKNEKLKREIAPWVWHFNGPMGKNSSFEYDREKAAVIVLTRNTELSDILHSMRQFEDRFNRNYHYPYIFLNDKPFTSKFMLLTSKATQSDITYSLIPNEHWEVPGIIGMNRAKVAHLKMKKDGVLYGDSMTYRQMCRFNSGFFYKHPLLADLKYYWRLEPNVDFYCDIPYDLFKQMRIQKKVYSFVIFIKELRSTIPTLWVNTLIYAKKHNITSNLLSLFTNPQRDYNLCHFWSNFEVASLDWLRSERYESYFKHLDATGNFFYERWGDAPVHSLAAGLFLQKNDIFFIDDIGYRHDNFARWPNVSNSAPDSNYDSKIGNDISCIIPKKIIDASTIPSHSSREKHPGKKAEKEIKFIDIFNYDYSRDSCIPFWKLFDGDRFPWTPQDTTLALMKYNLNNIDFNDDSQVKNAINNLKS